MSEGDVMKHWMALASVAVGLLAGSLSAQDAPPDYGQYRVLDVQELDLLSAPGNTAAYLSPHGTEFAHFAGGAVCFYRLDAGTWTEDRCFDQTDGPFGRDSSDVTWSPDGRYLSAPIFQQALQRFVDTDIQVMDTVTGEVINLTDDGVEGDLLSLDEWRMVDLAPVWANESALRFIRFTRIEDVPADAGLLESLSGAVFQVSVPANIAPSDAAPVMDLPSASGLGSYLLAVEPESGRMAVNLDRIGESPASFGVWQAVPDAGSFSPLGAEAERGSSLLSYSANGEWLMTYQLDAGTRSLSIVLIDTTTGKIVEPVLDGVGFAEPQLAGAGWAPTGEAFVYLVQDLAKPELSGLFLAPAPGEDGRLILPGDFYGTTCCLRSPIRWAANDLIMLGRGPQPGVLLVQIGP